MFRKVSMFVVSCFVFSSLMAQEENSEENQGEGLFHCDLSSNSSRLELKNSK